MNKISPALKVKNKKLNSLVEIQFYRQSMDLYKKYIDNKLDLWIKNKNIYSNNEDSELFSNIRGIKEYYRLIYKSKEKSIKVYEEDREKFYKLISKFNKPFNTFYELRNNMKELLYYEIFLDTMTANDKRNEIFNSSDAMVMLSFLLNTEKESFSKVSREDLEKLSVLFDYSRFCSNIFEIKEINKTGNIGSHFMPLSISKSTKIAIIELASQKMQQITIENFSLVKNKFLKESSIKMFNPPAFSKMNYIEVPYD